MIRLIFSLSRNSLRRIVDNDNLWSRGLKTKDGDIHLGCGGDVDTATADKDACDCFFYVLKDKADWYDHDVKPFPLFKGRTLVTHKKWKEQKKDYYEKRNAERILSGGKDDVKKDIDGIL